MSNDYIYESVLIIYDIIVVDLKVFAGLLFGIETNRWAKFVIDRATERPKGTAFVKFASEESAHKCIAESK